MRVSLLTVVALAACGATDPRAIVVVTPPPAPPDAGVVDSGVFDARWHPEDDAERLAAAECAWRRRCAPSLIARWSWTDTECRLNVRAERSEVLIRRGQLVADGRMRFAREVFEQCLVDLERDCLPVACDGAFLGVVPLDGSCGDSDECADLAAYCTGEPRAMCGVCARRKNGFEACTIDAECQSGRCTQRCLPPVVEGDRCEKGCNFGLCCPGSCVGPGGNTGTCRRAAVRGEACDASASSAPACDAALGLTCRGGVCAPVEVVGGNDACDASRWCGSGGSCIGGRCAEWPGPGEPCDGVCRGDDICRGGHCQPEPEVGEACVLDAHCAPRLWCRGVGERSCGERVWVDCP